MVAQSTQVFRNNTGQTDRQTDRQTDTVPWHFRAMHMLQMRRAVKMIGNFTQTMHQKEKMFCKNLEDEFDGEDSGKDEVEIVEDDVASGFLVDRVLGGQRNAAGADDDHYEQVEVAQVHDEVTETTHSADRANETHRAIDIYTYIQIYIETDLTIEQLPDRISRITDCNFTVRMLYRNMY